MQRQGHQFRRVCLRVKRGYRPPQPKENWYFNLLFSGHRGGIWEDMIRSFRRLLAVPTREQVVTVGVAGSYLAEAERKPNKWPQVPVPSDTKNKLALKLRDSSGLPADCGAQSDNSGRWKQVNDVSNIWRQLLK